jgi:hypothetical protein
VADPGADTGIAVLYIARGADPDATDRLAAFSASYRRRTAGAAHRLYVIYKGYSCAIDLSRARAAFEGLDAGEIYLRDDAFDIGAYRSAACRVDAKLICCLNSASVILCDDWLGKLSANLTADVGLVGCTGSYEAPQHPGMNNPPFPNPHLRSNAFLIDRRRFLALVGHGRFTSKMDAYKFEHGRTSLTRLIGAEGLQVLVVGRDCRGYAQDRWVRSETYRQGMQENLIVGDNQTRDYRLAPVPEKRVLFALAWGNGTLGQVPSDPMRAEQRSLTLTSGVE